MKEQQHQEENYSRDADQTRYLLLVGIISGGTLIGLFTLEILSIFGHVKEAFIFTPEIVHTLLPLTVGGLAGIGGFLYGRESGKRMTMNGEGNPK